MPHDRPTKKNSRFFPAEPRHSMMVTGAIIFASLMVRDLNAIAPLITMFFLVTYAMICAAVLIEQSLDLASFRPRMRIPLWVSFLGGTEPFESYIKTAPQADLNIFGLQPEPDFETIRRLVDQTDSTCMCVRDSGRESALA